MTSDKKEKEVMFKVYIRPQSVSDCFIATMDPQKPFKICLYPSINSKISQENQMNSAPEELEQLILHNYLLLKRNCMRD